MKYKDYIGTHKTWVYIRERGLLELYATLGGAERPYGVEIIPVSASEEDIVLVTIRHAKEDADYWRGMLAGVIERYNMAAERERKAHRDTA